VVEIELDPPEWITLAFGEIERLQNMFNFHDPDSALNRGLATPEIEEVWALSRHLQKSSEGAFFPYRDQRRDFSGIAKGYIVDRARASIRAQAPQAQGLINAGGDLAHIGRPQPFVHIRLGSREQSFVRELHLLKPCVATSAINTYTDRQTSNTRYMQPLARAGHTAVVQAPTAAVADALTKVTLFAPAEIVQSCCEEFDSIALVFDERAELVESFGHNGH
jgi:thiamine biosynthesis lipoprotein ApbE